MFEVCYFIPPFHTSPQKQCGLASSMDKGEEMPGEGTRYIKKVGMLVENFEIDP